MFGKTGGKHDVSRSVLVLPCGIQFLFASFNFFDYICNVKKINIIMPTVFELFGIRAFIIPGDHEPIHVHIEADGGFAKIQVFPDVGIIKQAG
ncbi:MAG: DUF4160 domain-containing protein, partial [Muribaculaceae bacterium]|nr:DUF4160 domain-containing protein [Muribaculaceae bacterium]